MQGSPRHAGVESDLVAFHHCCLPKALPSALFQSQSVPLGSFNITGELFPLMRLTQCVNLQFSIDVPFFDIFTDGKAPLAHFAVAILNLPSGCAIVVDLVSN